MSSMFIRVLVYFLYFKHCSQFVDPRITGINQSTSRQRQDLGPPSSSFRMNSEHPNTISLPASTSPQSPNPSSTSTARNTNGNVLYATKASLSNPNASSSYITQWKAPSTPKPFTTNGSSILFTKSPSQMLRNQNPSYQQSDSNLPKSNAKFTCDQLLAQESYNNDDVPDELCKKHNESLDFFCHVDQKSCNGNCGAPNTRLSCSCDSVCEIYDSCCPDFRLACPHIWNEAREKFSSLLDVKIQCLNNSRGYFIIASCPKDSSILEKRMCEETDDGPISLQHLHFKNRHCLNCHGFQEIEATTWKKTFRISLKPDGASFIKDVNADFNLLWKRASAFSWNYPFAVKENICSNKIVDSCPPYTRLNLSTKCKLSRNLVTVIESGKITYYKNKYCAQCNVKSDYACFTSKLSDLEDTRLPTRFSALITIMIDYEHNQTFLRAMRPFYWNLAVCPGMNPILNCKVISCTKNLTPINNSCIKTIHRFCIRISYQIHGELRVFRTCSSQNCSVLGSHYLIVNMIMAFKEFVAEDIKIDMINDYQQNVEIRFIKETGQQPTPLTMGVHQLLYAVLEKRSKELGLEAWFYFCVAVNDQDYCDMSTPCLSGNISLPVSDRSTPSLYQATGAAATPLWINSQLLILLVVLFI